MKKLLIIALTFLFFSCKKDREIIKQTEPFPIAENLTFSDTLDKIVDSTNFGIKNVNKINVYRIATDQNTFLKIYLYEKNSNHWRLKDSLLVEGDSVNNLNLEISDFNNDKFNDIIFTSGMAARGGNVVQTLILFSKESKKMKLIKNSTSFPNLMYNEKLDCIDALILTGGQTTYFLKIKNDSLKEFANVDQRDGRIVSKVLDKNGKWKEIINIKDKPEGFDRFINFNPIEERK
jgi:hypothetical protein